MKFTRILAVTVIAAMLLSGISACGGNNGSVNTGNTGGASEQAPVEEIDKTPITLTVFGAFNTSGVQEDEVSKHFQEEFGITLNLTHGEDEELKILAAGGDLPDIVSCGNGPDMPALIQSGQFMPLDDLLDKYGQTIKEKIPVALKYNREFIDPARKNIYFMHWAIAKSQPNNPNDNGFVGFFTRWDLYKAIGMPDIGNEDEYLAVLKQMVDYQPTNIDGKKVFAFSGWYEWGMWPYNISYPFSRGYSNGNGFSMNLETILPEHNWLEADSVFWQGLNFMRKANDLGLFDPEAFTMTADQYGAKVASGQVIVSAANWWQPDKQLLGEDAAMYILPGSNPYISQIFPEDVLTGWVGSRALGFSTNNKYPERSMQLVNYCNTDLGMRNCMNGMKGTNWDMVDGVPKLIGKAYEYAMSGGKENPDYYLPGNFHGAGKYFTFTLEVGQNTAADGLPYNLGNALEFKLAAASASHIDFASHYAGPDARIPGQAYVKFVEQKLAKSVLTYPMTLVDLDPDFQEEFDRVSGVCDAYVSENLAKYIMAPSEAEFKKEVQNTIDYCERMGLRELFDQLVEKYKESNKVVDEFMAEFR